MPCMPGTATPSGFPSCSPPLLRKRQTFDMGADHCLAAGSGARRTEEPLEAATHFRHLDQGPVKLSNLLTDEVEEVRTRGPARTLDLDDLLDLIQTQAKMPGLSDEGEERQSLWTVDSVSGLGTSRRGQDPGLFVEPKRLAAHTAPFRHLANQQAVSPHV